jgi:hypothetical protein
VLGARGRPLAAAVLVVAVALVAAMVAFSPYGRHDGFSQRVLVETTNIDAPCDSVFAYLGNSSNARAWSVYVDHITPLNPGVARDGEVGSIRRSFKRADETGMQWDEVFTAVASGRLRTLRIFNVRGAPLNAATPLASQQIFEPIPRGCRLSFALYFEHPPSVADSLAMHFAAYEISRIFRANIANVKRLTEAQFRTQLTDVTVFPHS